jgi:Fic family protein
VLVLNFKIRKNMNRSVQGNFVTISTVGEAARAFIPFPLPPSPAIEWSPELREKFDRAHLAVGRLDSASILLPDISYFLYMYVRKEAVLSSQIEGTQSSLSDLLLFEMGHARGYSSIDVAEVSNYVNAMNHGLKRLREGFPISSRLIREIHGVLLSQGRGSDKNPGEFRTSQNWVGGTRPGNALFVPPPAEKIADCMGQLEKFINNVPEKTPPLLKAALVHVQFETIHPFLDGNGRLGRLLIPLLLCAESTLSNPMLYISLYFKTYRQRYYELLNTVRTTGNWEEWLDFFADAVAETAAQAVETLRRINVLFEEDRKKISSLGRLSGNALRLHRVFTEFPFSTVSNLSDKSGLSSATIYTYLKYLKKIGIVNEHTGSKRNRIFVYNNYAAIINQGTDTPFAV